MTDVDPPFAAPEREMLIAWQQYQRQSILHKVEGLTDEQAHLRPAPGANSLLGIVYHLATVEYWWFRDCFAGEPELTAPSWAAPGDRDWEFHAPMNVPLSEATDAYRAQWEPADAIARAAPSLDDIAVHPKGKERGISLRWILIHMIEETARHAGHMDITRELIDGSTGML